MSRVFLIPTDYDFGKSKERVELTREMLSWNVNSRNCVCSSLGMIYKNVFPALLELGAFTSEISIYLNYEHHFMVSGERNLGIIYLKNEIMVKFSLFAEKDDYHHLWEWPKVGEVDVISKWTPEVWKSFFLSRIKEKAFGDLKESQEKADEANRVLEQQQIATRKIVEAANAVKLKV